MPGNYNLILEKHNPVLQFKEPGEALENTSNTLASSANKLSLSLTSNADTLFTWTATYPEKQHLACLYFERLSISGCSLVVKGKNGTNPAVEISNSRQVDDYLLCMLTTGICYEIYILELTVPDQGAASSKISLTPPFLGGVDMKDLGGYCYDWGRGYDYSNNVTYQRTQNLAFPQTTPQGLVKTFSINNIENKYVEEAMKFIRNAEGKLTLFIEYNDLGQEDLILGYISGRRSVRSPGNYTAIAPLVATAKNARI